VREQDFPDQGRSAAPSCSALTSSYENAYSCVNL
jgi:hypothetical protein